MSLSLYFSMLAILDFKWIVYSNEKAMHWNNFF